MNIVIAGITGFLGQRIKEYYKSKENAVFDYKKKIPRKIDLLINVAGPNSKYCDKYPKKAIEQRIEINKKILEIIKNEYVKNYIYISTIHVYEKKKSIDEKSNLNHNNAYSKSHIESEKFIMQKISKLCCTRILRVSNCFGYSRNNNCNSWNLVINNIVKNIFLKKKILILSKENFYRDYISVYYLIYFINIILKQKVKYKILNVSSNQPKLLSSISNDLSNIYLKRFKKKIDIQSNFNSTGKINKISCKIYNKKLNEVCQKLYYKELTDLVNFCYKNQIKLTR